MEIGTLVALAIFVTAVFSFTLGVYITTEVKKWQNRKEQDIMDNVVLEA